MKRAVVALTFGLALAGCGNADREKAEQLQGEVHKLQSEVASLKTELDAERHGAQRLLARAKDAKDAGDKASAKSVLQDLIARHPEKPEAATAKALLDVIDREEKAAEAERLAAEARKAEEARAALARLDKSLKKNTDEIKGITWVSHKSIPTLGTYMSLYFGLDGENSRVMPLRMKLQYHSDSWLFVQSVTIKADDQTFQLGSLDFERDNGYGGIWEWSDTVAENKAMLRKIADAKKVTIRFDGKQYYNDFILPDSQKRAIKEMILAWERYGGKA